MNHYQLLICHDCTQGLTAAPSEGRSSTASPMLDGKHWGPERTVEVICLGFGEHL